MQWLKANGIGFEEYNFFSQDLTEEEVVNILKYAHNGFEDIISERSKIYLKYKDQLDEMTTKELINFIIANPSILKRPLLVDHAMEIILVGYNENDLEDELI